MLDFCLERDALLEVASRAAVVIVLDHHKTALETLATVPHFRIEREDWTSIEGRAMRMGGIHALIDVNRSGAGLAWDVFHPGRPRPALVDHVEDRDIWRFALPGTMEVSLAISRRPFDFSTWDRLAETPVEKLIDEGRRIRRWRDRQIERAVKRAVMPDFFGTFLLVRFGVGRQTLRSQATASRRELSGPLRPSAKYLLPSHRTCQPARLRDSSRTM